MRLEISPSARAGCKDTVCKAEAAKIQKGELRFGVWVEIPDRGGSWNWKHWFVFLAHLPWVPSYLGLWRPMRRSLCLLLLTIWTVLPLLQGLRVRHTA